MKHKLRALAVVLLSAAVFAGAVAAVALVIVKRVRTGEWAIPDRNDVIWVKNRLRPGSAPPRIIYLHRGPITVVAGSDFSHENRSGLLAKRKLKQVSFDGFTGNDRRWRAIVKCVREQFEPFDVVVTDERPSSPGYVLVVVAGRPRDIGMDGHSRIAGLAPFNGYVVPDPVVFAFARELRNRLRPVCETIAMEVGHAYGLDHSYHCKDVMTYRQGCGRKRFVDKEVPCGETKARPCQGGRPTQNSYRRLLSVLGPRPPAPATK